MQLLNTIPGDSHPGFPWCAFGSQNKKVIEVKSEEILDAAEARLDRWAEVDDLDELKKDPTLIIKRGLRDPVRPFVKGEMHPTRKLATPRLIMAISIVDQLVERFIFSDFQDNEKRQYPNGSNMVGFGRSDYHDRCITQKVRAISQQLGIGPTASDVSGWERRVGADDLDSIPKVIGARMEPHPDGQLWMRLAGVWAVVSARPTYIVGNRLILSANPGMMPSGTYMTSYGNGIMRIIYALAAGAKYVVVLGDDCLEWHVDPAGLSALYNSWGLTTRDVQTFPANGFEFTFCSKYYNSSEDEQHPIVVPQSAAKMIASFANLKVRTPAHYTALSQELRGLPGPQYKHVMDWAFQVRYDLPPGVELDAATAESATA